MAKKLFINCATCDMRNVSEENYLQYENITINSAMVLTNENGKSFVNKMPVTLSCANVMELDKDADIRTINGNHEIKSSDNVLDKKFYMLINGSLTIGSNTQKQFEKCAGITVNGSVIFPESMSSYLVGMKVNGSSECYPDDAIILKRNAVIDHFFTLRAKNNLYWSSKRMIIVDPKINLELLKSKGSRFSAKEIIISESYVEGIIDLIDEKANIIIVPDGASVILDDITINNDTIKRYGTKLYIIGDVEISNDLNLDSIEYLVVKGDATVPQEKKDQLFKVLTEIDGDIKIAKPKSTVIIDKPYIKITKWMLEQQPFGITVSDCALVVIKEDIPKDLISKKLHISDCGMVKCSEEQEDAVTMICENVGKIGNIEVDTKNIIGKIFGGMDPNNDPDTKVINSADYVM